MLAVVLSAEERETLERWARRPTTAQALAQREAGVLTLGRLALDGTKIRANASDHTAMSSARMPERQAAPPAEIPRVREEAEARERAGAPPSGPPRGRLPRGRSGADRRRRRRRPTRGRAIYAQRTITGDPVSGQIKGRGCRRFSRRGAAGVKGEFPLVGAVHNLVTRWRTGVAAVRRWRRGPQLASA